MDLPYSLYTTSTATTVTKASSNADVPKDDYSYSHLHLPSDMAALLSNNYYVDTHHHNDTDDSNNNYCSYNYYYAHSFPGQLSPPAIHWEGGSSTNGGSSSVSDAASTAAAAEEEGSDGCGTIRAKIAAHPLYPKLLQAYIDCHKVGAPAETASLLDEMIGRQQSLSNTSTDHGSQSQLMSSSSTSRLGADPELDDFMESYYEVLVKYKWEMWRPFDEATAFLTDIQSQFHALCTLPPPPHPLPPSTSPPPLHLPGSNGGGGTGSSDEDMMSGGEVDFGGGGSCNGDQQLINEEDRELKERLIQKYGGYLSSLKHEFTKKKKKKGKLPKEARLLLLNWWNLHYKWPYPTEADKVALADLTGLDQKQINNWFINQRKRHWKPTDNMHSSVVDTLYSSPFFISDYPHHH